MLLVLTTSVDGTADAIFKSVGSNAFRFNFDLVTQYEVALDGSGRWSVKNPAGQSVSSDTVSGVFWWKAFATNEPSDRLLRPEAQYMFREIYNWATRRQLVRGTTPDFHREWGKLGILDVAKDFFATPVSTMWVGRRPALGFDGEVVVKSLSSEISDSGRALFTTEVDPEELNEGWVWFAQEKVDASYDVTALVCGSEILAFERSRADLCGLDWRAEQSLDPMRQEWAPLNLTADERTSIRGFADKLGVSWGRLDLLATVEGLVFLEYNANGQWMFLDPDGSVGVLNVVLNYLTAP